MSMNNETLEKIKRFAKIHHFGQLDKGGNDYFESHLCSVAESFNDNVLKSIAYLHDILEDTPLDAVDLYYHLKQMNIDIETINTIVTSIVILTKNGKPYDEYIDCIAYNKEAFLVKVADMRNNCDLSRLKFTSQKDLDRTYKYKKNLEWMGWE